MSVWLVVGDSELRALLLTIGEEAGIPVAAIEPETVAAQLNRNDPPSSMLVTRSLIPSPLDPTRLEGVSRLAVASGDGDADVMDGIPDSLFLKLPATLEDVERTLRWLASDGSQADLSSSNETSSRFA